MKMKYVKVYEVLTLGEPWTGQTVRNQSVLNLWEVCQDHDLQNLSLGEVWLPREQDEKLVHHERPGPQFMHTDCLRKPNLKEK